MLLRWLVIFTAFVAVYCNEGYSWGHVRVAIDIQAEPIQNHPPEWFTYNHFARNNIISDLPASHMFPEEAKAEPAIAIKGIKNQRVVFVNGSEVPLNVLYVHHVGATVKGVLPFGTMWILLNAGVQSSPFFQDPYRLVIAKRDWKYLMLNMELINLVHEDYSIYYEYDMAWSSGCQDSFRPVYPLHPVMTHVRYDTNNEVDALLVKDENTQYQPFGTDARLIWLFWHNHIGSVNNTLRTRDGTLVCFSQALYDKFRPCPHDCGERCIRGSHRYNQLLVGSTSCENVDVSLSKGEILNQETYYDSSCSSSGTMSCWFAYAWDYGKCDVSSSTPLSRLWAKGVDSVLRHLPESHQSVTH